MFLNWMDEIGEVARANPLKVIVIVFDLVSVVDGLKDFELPSWPNWLTVHFWLNILGLTKPVVPTFAIAALSTLGHTNDTTCISPHLPCQALGEIEWCRECCNTTRAWFHDVTDAHRGLTLLFDKPATAYELVIYYQLVGRDHTEGYASSSGVETYHASFALEVELGDGLSYAVNVDLPANGTRVVNATQQHQPHSFSSPFFGWMRQPHEALPLLRAAISSIRQPSAHIRFACSCASATAPYPQPGVAVRLVAAMGAVFGIDSVRIREDENDGSGNDEEGGHHGFEERLP